MYVITKIPNYKLIISLQQTFEIPRGDDDMHDVGRKDEK
jgi:hypothetical protein